MQFGEGNQTVVQPVNIENVRFFIDRGLVGKFRGHRRHSLGIPHATVEAKKRLPLLIQRPHAREAAVLELGNNVAEVLPVCFLAVELFHEDRVVHIFTFHRMPAKNSGAEHMGFGDCHDRGFKHRIQA